jgi:hypothetical protein
MITSVIVEGETDKQFVLAVFAAATVTQAEAVVAGGRSSAISLARSYLTLPSRTVALLLDADTSDAALAQEQRDILDGSLGTVAPAWQYGIFLAVPAIEATLFTTPQVAAAAFGNTLSADAMLRGKYEPKRTIAELIGAGNANDYALALQRLLSRPGLGIGLAECRPFTELLSFMKNAPFAEWVARGFRWPTESQITLPDGSTMRVSPYMHRSSMEKNARTDRQRSTLRFYRVYDGRGNDLGEKSELDIAKMLGEK